MGIITPRSLIQLTPVQRTRAAAFLKNGAVKKPLSLKPTIVAALEPEQLVSAEILDFELWNSPLDTPNEAHYGACSLSELRVVVGKKQVSWYVFLQGGPRFGDCQAVAVYNQYDAANRAYNHALFSRPVRRRQANQA